MWQTWPQSVLLSVISLLPRKAFDIETQGIEGDLNSVQGPQKYHEFMKGSVVVFNKFFPL